MRYLATKHGLMGSSPKEAAMIDMVMEGVESMRAKYGNLIYGDQLVSSQRCDSSAALLCCG